MKATDTPVLKAKAASQVKAGLRREWLMESSLQTNIVLLLQKDLLKTFHQALEKKKLEHACEVPLMEIWWFFTRWSLNIPAEVKLHFVWPCHLVAACGGGGPNMEPETLLKIGADFLGMKKVLCPFSIADHWSLLVIDMEMKAVRYVDTLEFMKMEVVKTVNAVLGHWRSLIPWLPEDIRACRTNFCRQSLGLACGYFVGWLIEEECRRSLGEPPFNRGAPSADAVVTRMLQIVKNLLPEEKRMHGDIGVCRMEGRSPCEGCCSTRNR